MPPPVTAFEGARVIVGDGSEPIENAVILVSNDRFVQGGPAGAVEIPEGARISPPVSACLSKITHS